MTSLRGTGEAAARTVHAGRPQAVQAALDELGAAMDALSPSARLPLHQQTLRDEPQPAARAVWRALHRLCSDASQANLERMASALEVIGGNARWAVREIALRAQQHDEPRRAVWASLARLVDALGTDS